MESVYRKLPLFLMEAIDDEGLHVITGGVSTERLAFIRMLCEDFGQIAPGKVIKYYYAGDDNLGKMESIPGVMSVEMTGLRTGHIMLEAEWAEEDYDLSAIIIDNFPVLAWAEEFRKPVSEKERIWFALTRLKSLAELLHVPVIVSCVGDSIRKRWPEKRDISYGDCVEILADKLIYLYNEERYDPGTERKGIIDVRVEDMGRDMLRDYRFIWIREPEELIEVVC
ncbi:MAG: hypothetical protein K6E50_00015 [Lachnospiraceae bacterium]|nr:hypothetical protein [Lachnospiraceae bacterium]